MGSCYYADTKFTDQHNTVRQRQQDGIPLPDPISRPDIEDDLYLRPVIPDDALILYLDDLPEAGSGDSSDPPPAEAADGQHHQRVAQLQQQLEAVTAQFEKYRLAVQQTLDERWGDDSAEPASGDRIDGPERHASSSKHYFESYAHNGMTPFLVK